MDGAGPDSLLLGAQVERRVVRRARHLAVVLFAVPLAWRVLALQVPPVAVWVQVAFVVLVVIGGLTLWRRIGWRPAE